MAEADPLHLTSPRIHLVRMAVFLILVGFLAFILYQPIWTAFLNNPGLNGLIGLVLLIGIVIAISQVVRLFGAVSWVNATTSADLRRGQLPEAPPPPLLAPMAAQLGAGRAVSTPVMRSVLDAIALRLDENREIVRYLAGLLVFLGLLGTFWGLLETVSSVGNVIRSMRTGGEAAALFDELKSGLAAPLGGMGISFSSSLFGLAGSLVLGFLDLQLGQAQTRFYTGLEDGLAARVNDEVPVISAGEDAAPALTAAIERLNQNFAAMSAGEGGRGQSQAVASLADGIRDLVQHMRQEQQLIRDWVEAQADQQRAIQAALERLAGGEPDAPVKPKPRRRAEELG
jgi:hypothetical protein